MYDIEFYEDTYGSDKRPKEVSSDKLKALVVKKAKFIYETRLEVLDKLKENGMSELYEKIELPLTKVLADMEITGIKVDKEYLEKVEGDLKAKLDILEKEIFSIAGCEFNIMSPAQLAKVLFEVLEIPYPKKVKDNKYSTSKDILDKIKFVHPIVDKILEYRTLSKLYTNYAVGLLEEVEEDGKIHTIQLEVIFQSLLEELLFLMIIVKFYLVIILKLN